MSTVADLLTSLVRAAVLQALPGSGLEDPRAAFDVVVPTQDPAHGDYQSNAAFRLGKSLKQNPRNIAEAVRAVLLQGAGQGPIRGVDVAGPGFLNLWLDEAWLGADLARRAADPHFGAPQLGAGRTVVIDYSSPNVAKRMHVGHLRSTIIGNALDRLHRFLGWNVVADNHIGDWGTPFGMLIVAWRAWRDEAAYEADAVAELQRIYQLFRERSAADPTLLDAARAETAKLQAGDPENRALWTRFVEASLREFQGVYDRLGVRFDVVLGESFYEPWLQDLVTDLLARGIARVDDGAVIVPFDAPGDEPQLAKQPLLVRKSDGAALYGTTDLATIAYRVERWNPERMVYVTDVRQQGHFRQVFAAARKMGFVRDFQHVWFGMLKLPDGQVAASRVAGGAINLVDVLDEAARRARLVVDERMEEIPDEAERAAVAEAVGTGAVRYADLCQNPQTDITFEWDKMLSLQGNSAPYLMYAHARCWSLLRRGGYASLEPEAVPAAALVEPEARALALALVRLPEAVVSATASSRPNLLADHVYGIASAFARFYLACPVLRSDVPEGLRRARLSMVVATARALALGLGLLGLAAPRRM